MTVEQRRPIVPIDFRRVHDIERYQKLGDSLSSAGGTMLHLGFGELAWLRLSVRIRDSKRALY